MSESTEEKSRAVCVDTSSVVGRKYEETYASGSEYGMSAENESVESKTDTSSSPDEDGNLGFVVIKPESSMLLHSQMEKQENEDNVFIIQNPDGLDIDGLDSDVLSHVQRVLAESGVENSSVMVVNEGDDNSSYPKETTTYIIDLNSSSSQMAANPTSIIQHQQHRNHEPVIYTSSSPPTTSVLSSSVLKPLVSPFNESASKTVNSNSNTTTFVSDNAPSQSNVDDTNLIEQLTSVGVNLLTSSVSVSNSACTKSIPKNLSQSSHSAENKSNEPTSPSTASPSSSSSTVTTSQVAEQLIHIAKKMIEDSSQGSQKISVDESLGKIVISSPESKQPGENPSSESVITMYLSSPNELKLKLKTLKTNSPVIVMQAGEEPSSSDENKENPVPNNEIDTTKADGCQSTVSSSEDITPISQRTDNIVAALSSLTSGGVLYRCSECGYSSHNKHYYKQHVDLVHNEERPYKCPHCDYAGKRRHALLEHMVVHSNQRPYSCNHCNASFRKKGHLTNHVKLHMSHRLVHCGVCNIQLPDAEAFEAHLRKIHKTDKLYRCKLCEHTVVERRAMLAHLATHNESIVFYCPSCSSYFNSEESLLTHMKETHDGDNGTVNAKSDKDSNSAGKSNSTSTDSEKSNTSSTVNADKGVQSPNIVCSECGFMCTDTQVMKKHMWVHIDSSSKESGVQLKDQAATSKKNDSGSSTASTATNNSSAMGVLKMNVVSGMKSLPENIVYQCTSCKFTSSDNSVFIKHMLLHKTQRNQQTPVSKDNNAPTAKPLQDTGISGSIVSTLGGSLPPTSGLGTLVTSSSAEVSSFSKDRKPDSSVPFVFDQPSGRYRCLICGYHCDFQRTIKAHIWKHSGNQNIEYPVFEQAKKPQSFSSLPSHTSGPSDQENSSLPKVEKETLPVITSSSASVQQHQSLKTSTGRVIQLLPFHPSTSTSNTTIQTLTQVKESPAVVFPANKKSDPTEVVVSTKSVPCTPAEHIEVVVRSSVPVPLTLSEPTSPETLIIEDKSEAVIEVGFEEEVTSMATESLSVRQDNERQEELLGDPSFIEGCTEPSVVVEVVDSVPSGFGLTGMKSQQGSPRVSDFEGSGNEVKLTKIFKEVTESKYHPDLKASEIDQEVEKMKGKYNLRKSKVEPLPDEVVEKVSRLKRDAPVDEMDISDIVSPQKRLKTYIVKGERVEIKEEEIIDELSNDESDETASSDDTASAGESGGTTAPQKSGICSSLLAVIEQLRERSRSESLSDKDLPAAIKDIPKSRSSKRSKKANANSEAVPALSEFHNIEKINEGDGEKFRCSLCHYTSHRICNMKIHMKTHRQKKPSECSLCDFASASPELLQEHMLQHCKVRTYACKFCPQSFNHKSTLRAHMRAHKDHEPFLCAYCVFETTNANDYREHMHVHSGCSSRLRCPACDHVMNSKEELTPHLMMCKGKSSQSTTTIPTTTTITITTPASSDNSKVNKPVNIGSKSPKHKDTPVDTKVSSSQSPAPTPESTTHHACVVDGCSFSSISLKELQDHLSIHCNPSLMVCDLCDFKALHSRSLKSHMKRHANDQRYVQQPLEQYKCNLCGYVCHHLPSLKSHMWRHASDQSYSYEFTNDVINAAIDHDSRADVSDAQPDDPELIVRFIHSESRIMEGELTNFGKGDGQRPTCWVTFRCCSCGFETINKAKLNIHMRSHSDIIRQALDVTTPRKPGYDKSNHLSKGSTGSQQQPLTVKSGNRRSPSTEENNEPFVSPKVRKGN